MKIIRWDKHGHDVTDQPEKWAASDVEVCQTQYRHPSVTSGMHTNGPAVIWVRSPGGEWVHTGETHLHKVLVRFTSSEGVWHGKK